MPRFSAGSQSSTLTRKKTSPRYSASVDFEKFLRIKSNLQQNISKKRQKVGDKRISMVFISDSTKDVFISDSTKDSEYGRRSDGGGSEGSPKSNDEDIYGDEWSSDDDDGLYACVNEPE
ncbi:hypothetical protein COOONC_08590 [Cooperia oncophora]